MCVLAWWKNSKYHQTQELYKRRNLEQHHHQKFSISYPTKSWRAEVRGEGRAVTSHKSSSWKPQSNRSSILCNLPFGETKETFTFGDLFHLSNSITEGVLNDFKKTSLKVALHVTSDEQDQATVRMWMDNLSRREYFITVWRIPGCDGHISAWCIRHNGFSGFCKKGGLPHSLTHKGEN